MSIVVTHRTTTYNFTVTAPEDDPFIIGAPGDDPVIIGGNDTRIAVPSIDFEIITDGANTLRNVGVSYLMHGHPLRADGTVTRAKRTLQGVNLNRIPMPVRLALQEGIRESVGALSDPLGQLSGYDGHRK